MANGTLNVKNTQVIFGEDSVIIQKWIADVKGGRALDVTGITDSVLHAGHIIYTDKKGTYKPLKVSGSAYETLPSGCAYAGVLYRSLLVSEPFAAIMTEGQVNEIAAKNAVGADVPADFKTALPLIEFVTDENAGDFNDTDTTADD